VYKISAEPDYLRAELLDRETVEETQQFLRAVVRQNAKHRRECVLILVRLSKPVFQVAAHRLIEYIEELLRDPVRQIALVGDSMGLHMSHEYIELLARQRGLNVRSFREEGAALGWLKDQRQSADRRQRQERRDTEERRRQDRSRRNGDRRASTMLLAPAG
jgi:hypothetical protein